MAEMGMTALIIFFGFVVGHHASKDIYLQCFQVDANTKVESSIGEIIVHGKNHHSQSSLVNWGPNHLNLENRRTMMTYGEVHPLQMVIYDADFEGFQGHALVLSRRSSLKNKFHLSEMVTDPSRLDYCKRVKAPKSKIERQDI